MRHSAKITNDTYSCDYIGDVETRFGILCTKHKQMDV